MILSLQRFYLFIYCLFYNFIRAPSQQPSIAIAQPAISIAQPTISIAQPTISIAPPTTETTHSTGSIAQPSISLSQPKIVIPSVHPSTTNNYSLDNIQQIDDLNVEDNTQQDQEEDRFENSFVWNISLFFFFIIFIFFIYLLKFLIF